MKTQLWHVIWLPNNMKWWDRVWKRHIYPCVDECSEQGMNDEHSLKYLSRCACLKFFQWVKKYFFPSWPKPPQLWTIKVTSNIVLVICKTLILFILVSPINFLKCNYGPVNLFGLVVVIANTVLHNGIIFHMLVSPCSMFPLRVFCIPY